MALSLICTDTGRALGRFRQESASACHCLAGLIGNADLLHEITDHDQGVLSISFVGIDWNFCCEACEHPHPPKQGRRAARNRSMGSPAVFGQPAPFAAIAQAAVDHVLKGDYLLESKVLRGFPRISSSATTVFTEGGGP